MKKVLVLMSTYNGERYLKEQIESIIQQKNVKCEILVRDDGSGDSTKDILEEYRKSDILSWYTGEHLNVAHSYLDLMKKASTYNVDYFAFCDQDDVWDLDKIYIAIQKLDNLERNKPLLYYCGQRLVDEKLNLISDHVLNRHRSLHTRFLLSDFAGCTGVFNRVLLDAVNRYNPNYILMHDTWILKICLGIGGRVIVDEDVHMMYRQHGNNAIGLKRGFFSIIKQVKQYIFDYKVEKQMIELLHGYSDDLIPEYHKLANIVCAYKENKNYKYYLLDKNNINFHNRGLNLTYWLKVNLNLL